MKNSSTFKIFVSIFLIFSMLTFVGCKKAGEVKNDTANVEKTDNEVRENTTVGESEIEEDEELALVVTEKRQKCAFINEKGEIVLEYAYKDGMLPLGLFSANGLARIQNLEGKYGFINKKGEVVIEPKYDKVGLWLEGLLPVEINGKYGFINEKGEIVVDAIYDSSSLYFENGMAKVKLNGRWGYVNAKGDTVMEHEFDYISSFANNGLACAGVYEENYGGYKYGYINKTGEWEPEPIYNFAENGLACIKIDGKYGYINKTGEVVIEPQFESAESFHKNGLAVVTIGGKEGAINKKGEFVIQPKYDRICHFCDNGLILALIGDGSLKEDNYFYMNENEEVIIDNQSVVIDSFFEETYIESSYNLKRLESLVPIVKNNKYGYIDNTGKVVIEPIYDYTYPYVSANGLIAVEKDGNWGYINKKGEVIIPFQFYNANPFS